MRAPVDAVAGTKRDREVLDAFRFTIRQHRLRDCNFCLVDGPFQIYATGKFRLTILNPGLVGDFKAWKLTYDN